MQIHSLFFWAASACILAAAAWRGLSGQGQQEVHYEAIPVSESIFMLDSGQGGNVGACVGADGIFLIDDQFERTAPKLLEALERLSDGPVEFLINTHFHGDHAGGNPILGQGATILAHENVRKRLLAGVNAPAMEPAGLPVVTFQDGISVHFNGEEIRLVHYPAGHTDGDSAVFFAGSDAVHLGDLYFNGMYPFIDLDSGGSAAGLTRAIADVLQRIGPKTRVIPGHGPLASREDLQRYHDMLEHTTALVKEALQAGNDVPAMLSDGLLAEYESMSWQFVDTKRFLETLVRELSAK